MGIYARISTESSTPDVYLNYCTGVLPISLSPSPEITVNTQTCQQILHFSTMFPASPFSSPWKVGQTTRARETISQEKPSDNEGWMLADKYPSYIAS